MTVGDDRVAKRSLRLSKLPARVLTIAQREPGQCTSPPFDSRAVGHTGLLNSLRLLQIAGRLKPAQFLRRCWQAAGRQRQDRPALPLGPAPLKLRKAPNPSARSTRAQDDLLLCQVVTHDDREVPLRPSIKRKILQYQHWVSCRNLGQNHLQSRLQRIDQQARSPGGCHQLDLQAAFSGWQIDLPDQIVRSHSNIALGKHGRQGSRPTLIVLLGKKGHLGQLDPWRQPFPFDSDPMLCAAAQRKRYAQRNEQSDQRLMQLTKLKMLVAQSMSVMMKITRNRTMMPTTPAPAGALSNC